MFEFDKTMKLGSFFYNVWGDRKISSVKVAALTQEEMFLESTFIICLFVFGCVV